MEACAGAHYWGRAIGKLGHTVRLIPPAYVKPFLKRQKNDAADAEAICEAAQRPTMRFVALKSEEQQASVVVFRARDLLVQQRTQTINALRGHLAEYGLVVSKGPSHIAKLIAQVEDPQSSLPQAARLALSVLVETLRSLEHSIKRLDVEIARRAREDGTARRLATIPGIGPITATALVALHHRRQRRHTAGTPPWCSPRIVACANVRPQAAHACDRRPCQQDGPHRLGASGEGRCLSSSGRGGIVVTGQRSSRGVGRSNGKVWRNSR